MPVWIPNSSWTVDLRGPVLNCGKPLPFFFTGESRMRDEPTKAHEPCDKACRESTSGRLRRLAREMHERAYGLDKLADAIEHQLEGQADDALYRLLDRAY